MADGMTGDQLQRLIDNQGWSRGDVARMLNESLGRKYRSERVGQWISGERPVPADVAQFLNTIAIELALPDKDDKPAGGEYGEALGGDTAPPAPEGAPQAQVPFPAVSASYERLCTELWEMVALGVGMLGAATGSDRLRQDGLIIDADKEALGKAYAKLAQTNETFRRMLQSMTTSGAWLEVALVTGQTAGKIWQNHSAPPEPAPIYVVGDSGTASA